MKVKSGIYAILNLVNQKCYIGSANNIYSRFESHREALNENIHKNKHLQNAYNKHRKQNFKFIILEKFSYNHRDELYDLEQEYLDTFDGKLLYNINMKATGRGRAGWPHLSGENHPRYGKGDLISGKNNPMYGKKHSSETKQKISESRKGKNIEEK